MENQRLFRLTSQSNDGVFDTVFNEDIEIPEGSEIALQSASFDRQSEIVKIDFANSEVDFGLLADPAKRWKINMEQGNYSAIQDGETLLASTAKKMNLAIDMGAATNLVFNGDGYSYSIDRGSQWRLQLDKDGKTEVRAKTNGPCLLSSVYWNTTNAKIATTVFAGTVNAPTVQASGTAGAADFMTRTGGSGSTNLNQSFVYGKLPMVGGTGCVRARIHEWTQTGAGLCATIGLVTNLSKLTSATIANTDIIWGLQLAGNGINYTYKEGSAGLFTDSGVAPEEITFQADKDNVNDLFEIVVGGTPDPLSDQAGRQSIALNIHQSAGGLTQIPITAELPAEGTEYYYFISFHRPIKLDMLQADLDPYQFDQAVDITVEDAKSLLDTVVRTSLDKSDFYPPVADREANFSFPTNEIGAFYGFLPSHPLSIVPQNVLEAEDYRFVSTLRAEFSVRAKNYLVLFDTLPLNSYDSYSRFDVAARNANSGGSRRNLLATVPVKEDQIGTTSVTQIAFEPSTLDYISLRNNSTFLTRTLGCRILTSTYQPIQVDGMASLTLLIKQHGSGSCS